MVTAALTAALTGGPPGWSPVAALLALAVLCWPGGAARARLAATMPRPASRGGRWAGLVGRCRAGRARTVTTVLLAAIVGGLVAGAGGGCAAGLAAGVTQVRLAAGARRRRHDHEVAELLDAIGLLTAELRSGAHPAAAATAAAATGSSAVHRVLTSVASGARLGAVVSTMLDHHADLEPAIGHELRRLAAAWGLAERHGAALAELMGAVRADLDARVRLAGQIGAQLAGPRASAWVLAGLPVLGLLLGQGMGARPWQVLSGTALGQLLLVLGTGLICAGITWSGHITGQAAPR